MFCKMYAGTLKGLMEMCMEKCKEMCKADPEMEKECAMDETKGCPKKVFCMYLHCLY